MRKNHFEHAKYFVVSFSVSFLVLLLFFAAMALVLQNQSGNPANAAVVASTDEYYLPKPEDNLNLLLIGEEQASGAAYCFILIRLDVEEGELPVAAFAPQTNITYRGKQASLQQVFRENGALAVQQALGDALRTRIDRYAVFDPDALIQTVDRVGYIEYSLKRSLQYQAEEASIRLERGRQLIDGQKFYDILRFPGYRDELERGQAASDLFAAYINERLEAVLSPHADALFEEIINLVDSNLSYADYDSRKEALCFLAKLSSKRSYPVVVGGQADAQGRFVLSDSTVQELAQIYSAH